ncbi:MAG: two-component system phosphate regulon sensor histidine kinase PhoR [Myxococcota bacterium]
MVTQGASRGVLLPLTLRTRLFLISISLVIVALSTGGAILESQLRAELSTIIVRGLTQNAGMARESLERLDVRSDAEIDELADRLGAAAELRLTVIDATGRVMGDSELTAAELETIDNHGTRPEVVDAVAVGIGVSRRHSATVDTAMLYVAVPFDDPRGGRGVVRAAQPLASIDALVWTQRRWLVVSGLIGIVLASGMSWLASYWVTAGLRDLVARARRVARAVHDDERPDEVEALSGSIDSLAHTLEHTVRELADERERFRSVLDGMAEATLSLDSNGRLDIVNPAARRLLSPTELTTGAAVDDLDLPESLLGLLRRGLAGESIRAEVAIELPPRNVEVAVSPLPRGGCTAVLHDVTGLRKLERVRRDFVANVSHELRTPTQTLRTTAETLLDSTDEEEREWLTEMLIRNASRLGSLVSDLLDLSRIEADHYPLDCVDRPIEPVIREAVATVPDRGRTVAVDVPPGVFARCDSDALHQVIVNLLDNATRHARPEGHVRVSAQTGARTVIEVVDDGAGIPPEHRARVFERFYRVDPGHSRTHGGTGLGLSIVRHLVEGMGGSITIDDGDTGGARVRVSLPSGSRGTASAPVQHVDVSRGRQ